MIAVRTLFLLLMGAHGMAAEGIFPNLVANGSFEETRHNQRVPDDWSPAGNRQIRQNLQVDTGADGKKCAKLECAWFEGDGGDAHAMICQVGQIGLGKGKWYRLRFRSKANAIKGGVQIALINRRPWQESGLNEICLPTGKWQQFEYLFQAKESIPPLGSRLQFWFKSTGELWLDDVELRETDEREQWFPVLPNIRSKNLLPNASFECGSANWGSFTHGLKGWAGNLFQFEGQIDNQGGWQGGACAKISSASAPTFYFDYYDPIRQPVKRILIAHQGWVASTPGERFTFSVYARASADGTPVELVVNEAPDGLQRKQVLVGVNWARIEFTFTAKKSFLFVAAGPDFSDQKDPGTVWLDGLQLERGEQATSFETRQPVESFLQTDHPLFLDQPPALTLRAFNSTEQEQVARGRLETTDFFDNKIQKEECSFVVPAKSSGQRTLSDISRGRQGFFRTAWITETGTQSMRYAVGSGMTEVRDGPIGMNHAYPWNFLISAARQAGVVCWRDWSAKWQTVEPKRGQLDFSEVDPQMDRVIERGGRLTALLPFPSAAWSAEAREEEIAKIAGGDKQRQSMLRLACLPKNMADFTNYARAVAGHFRSRPEVEGFQLLNEPLFTDYALSRQLGYTIADYLRLVQAAAPALRSANPKARIIAGIGMGPTSGFTEQFIDQGGLASVDILDLHLYDPPVPPESFEDSFKALANRMRGRGTVRPIWITEWGCYADDDPARFPPAVGDTTMNHCLWPNERAATENLVKFTAISFAYGTRKIFLHAGVCGTINGPDGASVLFEYGGTPRKMWSGIAALTRLLGVPDECVKIFNANGSRAYVFRAGKEFVTIAWSAAGRTRDLKTVEGIKAFDIMGNRIDQWRLTASPIYLRASSSEILFPFLDRTFKSVRGSKQ